MGKPYLPNLTTLFSSGILRSGEKCVLKENTKKFLRLIDEEQAVGRFTWDGLPDNFGLTSQEIERFIYYRGQLCLFYEPTIDKYLLTPYAGSKIDYYGRFTEVVPVPISRGTNSTEQEEFFKTKNLRVIYKASENVSELDKNKICVLVHDYTKQLSQTIIPRQEINDPIIDVMAECVPMMRTSLLASSGVKGVRVADADQAESVKDANRSTERAAMTGEFLVPIVGSVEFQELTDHATTKAEEYMQSLQSLDNLRLSGYGIQAGGVYEKKAHMLQSEADMNTSPVSIVLKDGLKIREQFCDTVNKVFGLSISCRISDEIDMSKVEEMMGDMEESDVEEMPSEGEEA